MGKATLQFTYYERKDPVSGVVGSYVRSAKARQTSPELKRFQACVASKMRGYRPTGATPAERSRALRAHFAQVAQSCK